MMMMIERRPLEVVEMPRWTKDHLTAHAAKLFLKTQFEGTEIGNPEAIQRGNFFESSDMALGDVFCYLIDGPDEKIVVAYSWKNSESYLFRVMSERTKYVDAEYDRCSVTNRSEDQLHESFMIQAQNSERKRKRSDKEALKKGLLRLDEIMPNTRYEDLKIRKKPVHWDGYNG